MQRDPSLADPLDSYEALRDAVLYGDHIIRCQWCHGYAEAVTAHGDEICFDCARERIATAGNRERFDGRD